MCLTEYNEAEAMEMFKEEGREEGRKEGREEGRKEGREEAREEFVRWFSKKYGIPYDEVLAALKESPSSQAASQRRSSP